MKTLSESVLPCPVVRDGDGKLVKEYSLSDWLEAMNEERTEVVYTAVMYREYPSYTNRAHLLEELADLATVCTSWANALGAGEDERADIQREVNEKNRRRGYLVGTIDRWNNAKKAEERERVKHD